jgi:hypothetical protein
MVSRGRVAEPPNAGEAAVVESTAAAAHFVHFAHILYSSRILSAIPAPHCSGSVIDGDARQRA